MRPRRAPTHVLRTSWRRLALALAIAIGASGCGLTHLNDLNFRVDDRLHFTSPSDRASVHQPFTVSWTIHDFTVVAPESAPPSDDAGYFAVFVDRVPVKPEQTLKAVADGDLTCEQNPRCPDAAYLHDHRVFVTTQMHLRLQQIPNLSGKEKLQMHTVTVVLMDTAGHRIGESAWELDVRLPRIGVA